MSDDDLTLDRPGARLAYDVSGTGPAVVAAHGMTSSRAAERRAGSDWRVLSDRHRVIAYDARGHGRSTGTPDPATYAWPALAEDLFALLDAEAPGETVDGIGSSMGCGTLLHAVVAQPERFRRLVLVIPPTAWEVRAAQSATYGSLAAAVEEHGGAAVLAMLAAMSETDAPAPEIDVVEELVPSVLRGAADSDLPAREALRGLTHRTLVLAWRGDPVHPLETAEALAGLLPDARLVVADGPDDIARWPELAREHLA